MAHGSEENTLRLAGLHRLLSGLLGIQIGLLQDLLIFLPFLMQHSLLLHLAHLHGLPHLDGACLLQLIGPQSADKENKTSQQNMNDKSAELEIFGAGKEYLLIASELQVIEK